MGGKSKPLTISTRLWKIAEQARQYPESVFINLVHHIDVDMLRYSQQQVRKESAAGVDGVTAAVYAKDLERNLEDLHERLRTFRYKAPAVKRVWLEKDDGKQRPIGMPAYEDKIVQRAVELIMSAVYEQDFHDFSHGFRKKHNQHWALYELREQCMRHNIRWILDADVSGYFDNISWKKLREVIKQRINDGGLLRLIGKWMNAGVMEDGVVSYPEKGTPQGGVISPLLANIFLHHILDDWFAKEVKPRVQGRCFLLRFADDFVIGFEYESDARRVLEVLFKRFAAYGLSLHPQKTKLINFRKPSNKDDKAGPKVGTFDFCGFTHYWAKSRKGYWVIKRKTMRKRMNRFMRMIWQWCRHHYHYDVWEQYDTLCSKLRGHYNYFGVRSNYKCLEVVYEYTEYAWKRWLNRRGGKKQISYEKFSLMKRRMPLPKPRVCHAF